MVLEPISSTEFFYSLKSHKFGFSLSLICLSTHL